MAWSSSVLVSITVNNLPQSLVAQNYNHFTMFTHLQISIQRRFDIILDVYFMTSEASEYSKVEDV